MAEYDPRLSEIVELIDRNNKLIYSGNWSIMFEAGWRQASFINTTDIDESVAKIKDYQKVHGPLNVALGHPIDETVHIPSVKKGKMGLYVRDADDLIEALRESLDDIVQVERWLNA